MGKTYLNRSSKLKFWRILLFILSVLGPFIKVRLLGAVTDLNTQLLYISYYFAIQFLIPLVDFGATWSSVRTYLEKKDELILFLSPIGTIAGILVSIFFLEYGLVILISVAMAILNYHLQVLRVLGQSVKFYFYKITRLSLDLSLLLLILGVLNFGGRKLLAYILLIELFSIVIILSFIMIKNQEKITYFFKKIYIPEFQDYSFVILKVIRSNFARLIYPVMFANSQFVKFFYFLLLYELVVQFANAEYLRKIIKKGISFKFSFLIFISSIPFQLILLILFAKLMVWDFTYFEYICIIIIGSITVYSIYSFRIISQGAYREYRRLIFFDICFKFIIFFTLYLFDAQYTYILGGILLNYFVWFVLFSAIHYQVEKLM